jgi:2-keto-4-pentenoate hydratase
MHAGVVLPENGPGNAVPDLLPGLGVFIDGVQTGRVDSSSLTAGPIAALAWLAAQLTPFGLRLCQGQIILTGSPLPLYTVAPGSKIVVEAPPLGTSRAEVIP